MSKKRTSISPEIAAKALFQHDRTCCVCRQRGKPVQLHHMDENPANHSFENLAVLCFDCHRETQIRGGFDRKLDRDQVALYRADWLRVVARGRAEAEARSEGVVPDSRRVALETSVAEIYRENRQYDLLAIHYSVLENDELRDKYIDLALRQSPSDETICFLRGLQGRADLIPPKVIKRQITRYQRSGDHEQAARLQLSIGEHVRAARSYIQGIRESLDEGRLFTAAYYLKELSEEGVAERLFEQAYREASEKGDLWWQVRALQELGWDEALRELLVANRDAIRKSGDAMLMVELARAEGEFEAYAAARKELASNERLVRVTGAKAKAGRLAPPHKRL